MSEPIIWVEEWKDWNERLLAEGFLVSDTTPLWLPAQQWHSWITGALPCQVLCSRFPEAVGHGIDKSTGQGMIFFDGIPISSASQEDAQKGSAENRIAVYVQAERSISLTPCFLLPSPFFQPKQFSVEVRLEFEYISELPDYIASQAYKKWIALALRRRGNWLEALHERFVPRKSEEIVIPSDCEKTSLSLPPYTGQHIPIFYVQHGVKLHGILIINHFSADACTADLLLANAAEEPCSGIELFRETRWQTSHRKNVPSQRFCIEKKIATICSVCSAKSLPYHAR